MAFYVSVPRDLSRVKTKVFFRLTKRQLICFLLAAAIGVPVYFLTKEALGASIAMYAMIASMMPLFLMALYEKNGKPAEVWLSYYMESRILRPRNRPYRVRNRYAVEKSKESGM